jgi:hypothetical protein
MTNAIGTVPVLYFQKYKNIFYHITVVNLSDKQDIPKFYINPREENKQKTMPVT